MDMLGNIEKDMFKSINSRNRGRILYVLAKSLREQP